MFEKALVMYIYAETPLHPGSGAVVGGAADLPIQRERHTEYPIIQGSSLKGVLRDSAAAIKIEELKRDEIFGKPDRIGGVSVTDAKMLAFPVRALKGVFGWITSPMVLDRFKRDLKLANKGVDWNVPDLSKEDDVAIVSEDSDLIVNNNIYIEDVKLRIKHDENLSKIVATISDALPEIDEYKAFWEKICKDLIIVADDVFRDFSLMTTEIATRIKIGESGTVERGGLWSEEYLPADTLMYSLILIPGRLKGLKAEDAETELRKYDEKILQVGGDETIGRGFARLKVV